jgi:hypothetical protein
MNMSKDQFKAAVCLAIDRIWKEAGEPVDLPLPMTYLVMASLKQHWFDVCKECKEDKDGNISFDPNQPLKG